MSLIEPNHYFGIASYLYGSQMGMNPLKQGEKSVATTIRLPESDRDLIQQRADDAGMKFSEYVRHALLNYDHVAGAMKSITEHIESVMADAMNREV